ncbi:MAG: PDGLE domain-containing protein [Burkholderiaceae bacterium]|nr:PDGLE domain-containing protein [Burkholderiaceae bacterium]
MEWSIEKTAGSAELDAPKTGVHGWLARLQERVAILPDYALRSSAHASEPVAGEKGAAPVWPAIDSGTSLAGIVGGAITLALVWLVALLLKRRR